MTQKHFEIIAETLGEYIRDAHIGNRASQLMIEKFVINLSRTNPRFNPDIFRRAVLTIAETSSV